MNDIIAYVQEVTEDEVIFVDAVQVTADGVRRLK